MTRLPVLFLCAALLMSSCSGGRTGGGGLSDGGLLPTGRATNPCAAVAGCVEVSQVDVDGDKAVDRVGITVIKDPTEYDSYGTATVSVRIATGDVVKQIDVASPGKLQGPEDAPTPYVGAYRISRTSGADVVLHTRVGAGDSEQFVVIGWKNGGPALVPRPPELNANFPDPNVWYIGSSHGLHEWVTCADGTSVTMVEFSAPEAEGIPLPGGGIREQNTFSLKGDSWSPQGSENIADGNFSYDFDPNTETFKCDDQGQR